MSWGVERIATAFPHNAGAVVAVVAAVVVVAPLALAPAAPVAPVENSLGNLFGILMNSLKRFYGFYKNFTCCYGEFYQKVLEGAQKEVRSDFTRIPLSILNEFYKDS